VKTRGLAYRCHTGSESPSTSVLPKTIDTFVAVATRSPIHAFDGHGFQVMRREHRSSRLALSRPELDLSTSNDETCCTCKRNLGCWLRVWQCHIQWQWRAKVWLSSLSKSLRSDDSWQAFVSSNIQAEKLWLLRYTFKQRRKLLFQCGCNDGATRGCHAVVVAFVVCEHLPQAARRR
jgi:hypothetical protein